MKARWQKRTIEVPESLEIMAETAEDREELLRLAEHFGCTKPVNASHEVDEEHYFNVLTARLRSIKKARTEDKDSDEK